MTRHHLNRRKLLSLPLLGGSALLAMRSPAIASCLPVVEEGLWRNSAGDSPYQLQVQAGSCEFGEPSTVTVWVRQSSGKLYTRGTFAAGYQNADDGTRWLAVQPYGTGGYKQHLWLRRFDLWGTSWMMVRVLDESLDSKPSASSTAHFTPA